MKNKKLVIIFAILITIITMIRIYYPVKSESDPFEIVVENMEFQPVPGSYSSFYGQIGVDLNQRSGPDINGLEFAEELGATTIRTDFFRWHAFEIEPGTYDFTIGDQIIQNHELNGFQTMLNIHGGNENYTGAWNNPPSTEEEFQNYKNYLKAIASHYKNRGLIYEIYYEPYFIWRFAPEEFANIVQVSKETLKFYDPSAIIITGGLYITDTTYVHDFVSNNGYEGIDYFGLHSPWRDAEKLDNHVESFNNQFLDLGEPIPIYWDTEKDLWGDSRNLDESIQQANRVVRSYLRAWRNGLKGTISWCFIDISVEEYCGLLTVDYEKKLAFHSLKLLNEMTSGRMLIGELENLPELTYGLRLDGSHDVMCVVWNTEPEAETNPFFSVPYGSTAIDYLGNPVLLEDDGDSLIFQVNLLNSPVYVNCSECKTSLIPVYLPLINK